MTETEDPIFGSLENDTYKVLRAIKEDLDNEGVPCTVYHVGQELGKGECLEIGCSDLFQRPRLMFDGNRLVFCFVLLGIPDQESLWSPKKFNITAVDICDPNGFQTIIDSVKNGIQTMANIHVQISDAIESHLQMWPYLTFKRGLSQCLIYYDIFHGVNSTLAETAEEMAAFESRHVLAAKLMVREATLKLERFWKIGVLDGNDISGIKSKSQWDLADPSSVEKCLESLHRHLKTLGYAGIIPSLEAIS